MLELSSFRNVEIPERMGRRVHFQDVHFPVFQLLRYNNLHRVPQRKVSELVTLYPSSNSHLSTYADGGSHPSRGDKS